MIKGIQDAVTIPVMAKARIGHFVEAQVLQALEVDYIDESEVLTPADEDNHIDKWAYTVPFVCGATNLGEALRRLGEGAAMIRSKGEAGTGDIVEAVRHLRKIRHPRFDGWRRWTRGTAADCVPRSCSRRCRWSARLPPTGGYRSSCSAPGDRDSRRRVAGDVQLGAEGGIRRLRDLQVLRSRAPRSRDRRGDDPLRRPGQSRGRIDRPRAGDGQHRDLEAPGRRAALPTRLVSEAAPRPLRGRQPSPLVGVLARSRAVSGGRPHRRCSSGSVRSRARYERRQTCRVSTR